MKYLVLVLALAIAAAAGCSPDRTPADGSTVAPPPADTAAPPVDTTPTPPADTPTPPAPDDGTADDSNTVPARFQGKWATDAAACTSSGDESHLTIAADRITFHESSGTIASVTSGPTELSVVVRVTGEGETREATYRFRLSGDGNILTDLSSGTGMVRQRCG